MKNRLYGFPCFPLLGISSACFYATKAHEPADTALRLSAYFGLPAQFWMNLHADYDLRLAAANQDLKKIKPHTAA